jgi:ribosomal protein L34E
MVRPMLRNRRLKKKLSRTPGGRVSMTYSRKGKIVHRCSLCGMPMTSVKSIGPKSGKTQSRIYGGNLCHACLSTVLKYAARVRSKALKTEDVPIRYRELVRTAAGKA